jgi:hypothetical protein
MPRSVLLVTNPTNYVIKFNGSVVEDVAVADVQNGIIKLYERDWSRRTDDEPNGPRILDPNDPTGFRTLELRGVVEAIEKEVTFASPSSGLPFNYQFMKSRAARSHPTYSCFSHLIGDYGTEEVERFENLSITEAGELLIDGRLSSGRYEIQSRVPYNTVEVIIVSNRDYDVLAGPSDNNIEGFIFVLML